VGLFIFIEKIVAQPILYSHLNSPDEWLIITIFQLQVKKGKKGEEATKGQRWSRDITLLFL